MHDSCICESGEQCYHESFVFSVGETRCGSVEMSILQVDGRLSRLAVVNFSSWKKTGGASRIEATKNLRGFQKTVMIERIQRYEHCLAIHCNEVTFSFFGSDVKIEFEDICQVDPPRLFGEKAGREYRSKYLRFFDARAAGRPGRT